MEHAGKASPGHGHRINFLALSMCSQINLQQPFLTMEKSKRILIVSCDMPSHPYAAAKLAKALAPHHQVVLAGPEGATIDRLNQETASTSVKVATIGTVSTKKHMNERPVKDPLSWQTFWETLKNPFVLPMAVENLWDQQEGMYEPLRDELRTGQYDLVFAMHSTINVVADAAESVAKEGGPSTPVAIFSSLPYEPAMYLPGTEGWDMPRCLTTFPHVSTYSSTPKNLWDRLVQTAWRAIDMVLTNYSFEIEAAAYNNARRARRGLPPMAGAWKGYVKNYPTISFGGVFPFLDAQSTIAEQVTVVGSLEAPTVEPEGDLEEWIEAAEDGFVYASFGTGTELSADEAAALIKGLAATKSLPSLVALRSTQQRIFRDVWSEALGAEPTAESSTHLEYLGGRIRIQADVPQAAVLASGKAKVFVSHMGMGGFVESVKGGVPIICYPSGCDQYFNAQRAVDAGMAVIAPMGLGNLDQLIKQVLADAEIQFKAREAAKAFDKVDGVARALAMVDKYSKKPSIVQFSDKIVDISASSTSLNVREQSQAAAQAA